MKCKECKYANPVDDHDAESAIWCNMGGGAHNREDECCKPSWLGDGNGFTNNLSSTIEQRADKHLAEWREEVVKRSGRTELAPQTEIGFKLARRAFIDGATEQRKIDIDRFRIAYCKHHCPHLVDYCWQDETDVPCNGLIEILKSI